MTASLDCAYAFCGEKPLSCDCEASSGMIDSKGKVAQLEIFQLRMVIVMPARFSCAYMCGGINGKASGLEFDEMFKMCKPLM